MGCEWISQELSTADFGDQRLNKRFLALGEKWSQSPESSIPEIFDDWASVKAVYRFFENKKVTPERILFPHLEHTLRRMHSRKWSSLEKADRKFKPPRTPQIE